MDGTGRIKRKKKKNEIKEATPEEKMRDKLQGQVDAYMHIWRAAAFGRHKIVLKLLESGVNADSVEPASGNTPLILAALNGHVTVAEVLINQGKADANAQGAGGMTALQHAARNDAQEVVRYLLDDVKVGTETEDAAGNTAANDCARMGCLKVLEMLGDAGANLDHPNKRGVTPFMGAAFNGRGAIVDLLVKRNVNVNASDVNGNTAMHFAAQCGYTRVARQLLVNNVKLGIENRDGQKPEDLGLDEEIVQLISSYGEISMS
jgi:ankyrin repeat protein